MEGLKKRGSKEQIERSQGRNQIAIEKEDDKIGTTGMNGGYAKACNQGVRESSGEYIAILTDDVTVPKEWLSGMLECLRVSSDTGIVGPMIYGLDGRQGLAAPAFPPDELDRFAREFRETRRHRWAASQNVSARCALFRHDLIGKIGPFDEQFGAGDFAVDDYCLRASLEGFRTVIAGDVVLRHEKSTERTDNQGQTAVDKTLFQDKWGGIDSSNPLFAKLLAVNALQLADELNQKAQVDDAVSALLNATRHSGDERLHRSLVDILIENKRYKDGLDILNKMPEEMRKTENWYEQLASCASGLEQFEKAEQYADEALNLNSNSAAALNIKGFVAFKKGNRSEAENLFRKATESDKGFGEAYCNLAGLRWLAGDKESAIILFEKAFILSPSVPDVALSYYTIAANLKQFARAADLFREAVALYPLNKKLKFTLIDILLQQAEYDQALKEAEEAMVTFGTDDQTLSLALGIREKIGAMRIGTDRD